VLNGLEWIVLTAAVLEVFVVGDLVLCGGHAYCREFMGPAIVATALYSNSAPRIVAITTITAPATPTARTSFSITFPS
jgi:hypothetical protein